jgi:hypothetical protein
MGPKNENEPSEPKNGIWASKSIWSCDISINRVFIGVRKNILLWVKKAKIGLQSPKTEFGAPKSIWSCDISINREFYIA